MSDSAHLADLDLAPNEASGLLRVDHQPLLDAHGWDRGFWCVLDEVDVAECVGLLGHRGGADLARGWTVTRPVLRRRGDEGRADDAEALARHDGWVYLFGSQHGGKEGPIRRREQWVARFREDAVARDAAVGDVEVVRTRFTLHRLLNDAFRDRDVALLPMRQATREAFIEDSRRQLRGTAEEGRVLPGDWVLNVEGAEFLADGTLLLGLRFPVAADGRPVVVRLAGCERLFAGGDPQVTGFWIVDAVGRDGDLAGVRDLCLLDDQLHVVTGNLDSRGKGSVILDDYPGGRHTVNTHFRATLDRRDVDLAAKAVHEFPQHPRIEGIAADPAGPGRFFYVSDEDETVRLRSTPLLSATPSRSG